MYLHCLKSRSIFLFGFGIGFFLAICLFIIQGTFNNASTSKRFTSNRNTDKRNSLLQWFISNRKTDEEIVFQTWKEKTSKENSVAVTYGKWLKGQNFKVNHVDLDAFLYGPKRKEELESNWLKSNIHITCIIFVKKLKLAKAIQDTWGKRCNRIYFFGQQKDSELPVVNVKEKLVSSWQLLCEAFNYIWKQNHTLEWLIFVKDDTLVIPENLRYMLAPLNHTQDYYLGHAVMMWGQTYNTADAGYVINVGVLRKLVNMFNNSDKCITGGKYWKQEDYFLAKHLSSIGIHPSDTRDQYLRGTFHGYSLQSLLWGVVKASSYWTHAVYPIGNECCSFMSVTLNVGDPDKMYTMDFLLYHLYVLKREGIFGKRGAPTSISDDNVWKIALKEEFNITHLDYISSDAYYEIWHSKYSEPEQLINKNCQRKRS